MSTDPKWLKGYKCFETLSDEQLNNIAQLTQAICYPAGQVLCEEDEPGRNVFFLVKGEVEVLYNIGEEDKARVDSLSNEEIFGCSALAEPYTYSATVRCLKEVEVLVLDAVSLRDLMEKDCCLGLKIQQYIISSLTGHIIDLRLGMA